MFTVDLQRPWLEQHRRLEWVKEELDEAVQQWQRAAAVLPSEAIPAAGGTGITSSRRLFGQKITRRRYLAAALVVAAAAVYLVVAAVGLAAFQKLVAVLSPGSEFGVPAHRPEQGDRGPRQRPTPAGPTDAGMRGTGR